MTRKLEVWECPVQCGECCYAPNIRACRPLQDNKMCKHHTDEGCSLKTEDRPRECNSYLCIDVARETPGYEYRGKYN